MTAFPTVELTVYPYDCDAFGHLNQAALLTLLERARWEALARGPGMDLLVLDQLLVARSEAQLP